MEAIMSTRSLQQLKGLFFCLFAGFLVFHAPYIHAQRKETITINLGAKKIVLPSDNAAAGVSLSIADLGTDHVPELIVGDGLGSKPRVHALRQDGTEIGNFLAFDKNMTSGINVSACDLGNDGVNEIIVTPQRGGGPHLRVFSNAGKPIDNGGVFAYDKSFMQGMNLACGDLDDDGISEIVTLPGAGSSSDIKIWNLEKGNLKLKQQFFAFDASDEKGFVGVVHDKQLSIAEQQTKNPIVRTYVIHSPAKLISEKNILLSHIGVASLFIHNDHLFLSTTNDGTIIDTTSDAKQVFKEPYGSVIASESDLHNDGKKELIIAPSKHQFDESTDDQTVIVDTSNQRLFAYANGILENTFLVSTSKEKNGTPLGIHHILEKIQTVHYAWNYGANDKRNYDLGWVPFNLRFAPHIYLHYAPWHNNFGYRMTHGCVNIGLEHMKWLYAWAHVNTTVDVKI